MIIVILLNDPCHRLSSIVGIILNYLKANTSNLKAKA